MFKVLYILFFIGVIIFLQYLLYKPETFDNHEATGDEVNEVDEGETENESPSDDNEADRCLDFNYLIQPENFSTCCSVANKKIGCRRPLCESAAELYNHKLDENNKLKTENTTLLSKKKLLETKYNNLENQTVDYMKYPGVLSLGNSTKASDITGADQNGCLNNISIDTAKTNCNNSENCNSFFSYNPTSNGRVCFASEYGKEGEIILSSSRPQINNPEKTAFFVKVQ